MVGGLVEEEQVGVLEEEPGQRQAAPLPATERARRECLIGFGQANAVEHLGDPVVIGVAIQALILVLDIAVFLDECAELRAARAGHGRLQPRQPLAQPHDVGPAV